MTVTYVETLVWAPLSDERPAPTLGSLPINMAVGQNQRYHVGVGAPPNLVDFSRAWDVHWGYEILTHGHMRYLHQ